VYVFHEGFFLKEFDLRVRSGLNIMKFYLTSYFQIDILLQFAVYFTVT
jgi:hypothetical protein